MVKEVSADFCISRIVSVNLGFIDQNRHFHSIISSAILTSLSESRSRPTSENMAELGMAPRTPGAVTMISHH